MEAETVPWITQNWMWLLSGFYVLEKIVKLTPTKYDDIAVDIIWGAIRQAAGKPKKK